MASERVVFIGTAPSWQQTPWADTGLVAVSLNDAYRLKGFVRADMWADLHPLDRFWYPPEGHPVYAHQVPLGYYSRPATHLEWLGRQSIPIYLHPEYRSQYPPAAAWRHARPFPKAEVEDYFGRYFTSSPAWLIAHLIMQGVKELWVTGIHLSTEHEYLEQRPQFEFLCGRLLGRGRLRETIRGGFRYYETADALLVLPEASPVLSARFQYAFEPRPLQVLEQYKWELHKIGIKRERLIRQLSGQSWADGHHMMHRPLSWWKRRTSTARQELQYLDAWREDVQESIARAHLHAEG